MLFYENSQTKEELRGEEKDKIKKAFQPHHHHVTYKIHSHVSYNMEYSTV